MPASAQRFRLSLTLILGLVVYAATLAMGSRLLDDPDPYWHIVAGRWIIAHRAVPYQDIFSHSAPGIPWVAHEWLAEIVMAALYDRLGWAGLVVAASLCFAATIALLLRALLRYLEPPAALIAAGMAWGVCLPHLLARPHVFTLPIAVLWVSVLVAARADDTAPSPWAALLMLLWANFHGGYLLGIGLAALFAGEMALDQPDWRAVRVRALDWTIFLGLSVLAVAATPNGIAGVTMPFRLLGMDSVMATVTEWQSPNFQHPQPLEPWLMLALLGALCFGIRLPVTRAAMMLLLLHLALAHRRFAEILGIAAPVLVAPALAPQLASLAATPIGIRMARLASPTAPGGLALTGVIAALMAGIVVHRSVVNDKPRFTPAAAVAFVQAQRITGPVFNAYNFGGYLIFSGIAPFIDGRADMYGDAIVRRYQDIAALPDLLAEYRITWTLLPPRDARVTVLDHLPGWRRAYADDRAVVHALDGAATAR